jgi:general stress protein YciG
MSNTQSNVQKPRGFAALTPERRREISRKGGVTAHVKGSAHEWDSPAAREAGRKGGLSHSVRRAAEGPGPGVEAPPPDANPPTTKR